MSPKLRGPARRRGHVVRRMSVKSVKDNQAVLKGPSKCNILNGMEITQLLHLAIVEQSDLLGMNLEQIRCGVLLPHPALARVKRRLHPCNLYRSRQSLLSWQLHYRPTI